MKDFRYRYPQLIWGNPVRTMHYCLPFSCPAGSTETSASPDRVFRPKMIRTNVDRPGLGEITNILIGTQTVFIPPFSIDLYEWSVKHNYELEQEFLKSNGLDKMPLNELQRYLDRHEMEIPQTGKVDMQTCNNHIKITVQGRLNAPVGIKRFTMMLLGQAIAD